MRDLLIVALGLGHLAAALVVVAGRVAVAWADFLPFYVLSAAMLGVAHYVERRGMKPLLGDAAAMVGTGILGLLACGLVSNIGLRLGMPLVDPMLARIDALAGINVAKATLAFANHPWAIEMLTQAYNLSPGAVVALIALHLFSGRREHGWEMIATVVIAMQVVAVISIIVPAIGAMIYFGLGELQGAGLPRGAGVYHLAAFQAARSGLDPVFGIDDISGLVTFPSFHTVLALMLAQGLASTRLRWLGVAASALVIVSTIPIGGHYVIDLVAGFAIWSGCVALARRFNNPSG